MPVTVMIVELFCIALYIECICTWILLIFVGYASSLHCTTVLYQFYNARTIVLSTAAA